MRLQHLAEITNAARGQGLDRSGRDSIDPNFVWAYAVSQVTDSCLQGSFGYAHDVIARYNFLRAEVTQGDHAAALGHQRGCGPGQRDQRIDTNIVGEAKTLARCIE